MSLVVIKSAVAAINPASSLTLPTTNANTCSTIGITAGTLPAAGAGVAADTLTRPETDLSTTSSFFFDTEECTGLELHGALRGLAGTTSKWRVYRELEIADANGGATRQWTYRHHCDITATASAQTGVSTAGAPVIDAYRWAYLTVTSDLGLTPLGTRTLNGTATSTANSVVIDPMGAKRVMVVVAQGDSSPADRTAVFASKWSGQ